MEKRTTITTDEYTLLKDFGFDISNLEPVYALPENFAATFITSFIEAVKEQSPNQAPAIPTAPSVSVTAPSVSVTADVDDEKESRHPSLDIFKLSTGRKYKKGKARIAALEIAGHYVNGAEVSRKDIYAFLAWKGFSQVDYQNAVDYLKRTGFLTVVEQTLTEQTKLPLANS